MKTWLVFLSIVFAFIAAVAATQFWESLFRDNWATDLIALAVFIVVFGLMYKGIETVFNIGNPRR